MKKEINIIKKHKVFIIDDHPIVRQGLAQLINQETDFIVCGETGDIPQALIDIKKSKPDIIILDISIGHANGIRFIEDLLDNYPNMSILVFTMKDENAYAQRCLKAGAKGYIMKQEPIDKVVLALREILDGEIYIADKLSTILLHKYFANRADASDSPAEILSKRELEVFQLIGQGLKTKKIAEELNLRVNTIDTFIHNIKKKMDFKDSHELHINAVEFVNETQNVYG